MAIADKKTQGKLHKRYRISTVTKHSVCIKTCI